MIALLAVVIALALPYLTPDLGGASEQRAAARPQVRVLALTPFTVVGDGFRAGETVRVTVHAESDVASARDGAGSNGRIAVRVRGLKLGKCPSYVVAARGDKGSTAGLRSLPRACGIDPRPTP